ncbi:unnamed protein product, partial [Ectocarpus sp. 12 AP-2014]
SNKTLVSFYKGARPDRLVKIPLCSHDVRIQKLPLPYLACLAFWLRLPPSLPPQAYEAGDGTRPLNQVSKLHSLLQPRGCENPRAVERKCLCYFKGKFCQTRRLSETNALLAEEHGALNGGLNGCPIARRLPVPPLPSPCISPCRQSTTVCCCAAFVNRALA